MLKDAEGLLDAAPAFGRNDKESGMSHFGDGSEDDGWYEGSADDKAGR